MLNYIEYLNVPTTVAITIVAAFLIMQIVGEMLEFKGKVVPEFLKIRKYFSRKKAEKAENMQTLKEVRQLLMDREENAETLKEVKQLLSEVNGHYSEDNITKRNSWMTWVNDRAEVYDNSIIEISKNLSDVTQALRDNTKLTEEMFIQSSRDRIIDFATKVADDEAVVSREEFNRIFKVYAKYEKYLEEHDLTNGEVDVAIRIIREAYEHRMKKHLFIEDVRGYEN